MKIEHLTIRRSEWLRGETSLLSMLRDSDDGRMCCLGFLALACGATKAEITNRRAPRDAKQVYWPSALFIRNKNGVRPCDSIITVNDDSEMSDSEREIVLSRLFAEIGIEVTFVDGT